MVYLTCFKLPDENQEAKYILPSPENPKGAYQLRMECYSSTNVYPFKVFTNREMPNITFSPITFFYGSNGSGKSTLLNIIGEKLKLERSAPFNCTPYFENYLDYCRYECNGKIPRGSKMISSDDVFDFLLDTRAINQGIENRRQQLFEEYERVKSENIRSPYLLESIDDYQELKYKNSIRFRTKSQYTSRRLNTYEVKGRSNGESGFAYFTNEIRENALYLLDEPENSLSPKLQLELMEFLQSSVRFYGCQFIISTHSPFLLSMKDAKIYDLDSPCVKAKKWTELENVQSYYNFFKEHSKEFQS